MKIVRVHSHTAHGRSDAQPARTTGFAQHTVLPQGVADFSNGRTAITQDLAHFAALKTDLDVFRAFFVCDDLSESSRGTYEDTRASGGEGNGVDDSAGGDEVQRKDISWLEDHGAEKTEGKRVVRRLVYGLCCGLCCLFLRHRRSRRRGLLALCERSYSV
ncbi:hypothetical protein CVT25_002049 [Psilocybe cyanescens]|uniref:Uncharacterized protein n=1 Tax=Psilocybe cyanescens TaxID=93625 RepID=A0A409VT90_PSICY|nr:hypothetical protein CVT25_002049 [Psilocybe cyanescens]